MTRRKKTLLPSFTLNSFEISLSLNNVLTVEAYDGVVQAQSWSVPASQVSHPTLDYDVLV